MKLTVAVLVCLFAGILFPHSTVKASPLGVPLWTNTRPTMSQNMPIAANVGNACTGYLRTTLVTELRASMSMCVYGDERLKIGYFSGGSFYRGAVEFPFSNDWHLLEGVCTAVICRYSADTDILVTDQIVGQYAQGTVVFKHASSRIHRIQTDGISKYVFDSERPDYAVKNNLGEYLSTASFGLSENGKWLVIELRNSGLAVVDTDSMTARHIVTSGYRYGNGSDPSEQLAVSNDGKSVALMGNNVGFSIIDVVPGCGQALVGNLQLLPSTTTCPSSDVGIGTLFPNFKSAEQPRFFGDGQQLEVIVNSWVDGSRRVTFIREGGLLVQKLKLLSLGDSFSSGEGETDARRYQPGTDDKFDNCHISFRASPFLVAQRIAIENNKVKSVACSGAKVGDIVGSSDTYWGQNNRLGAAGLKLSSHDKKIALENALDGFQPGRVRQSAFLERYNPESIMIGIGGNDAGLMGKLKACSMPGTCEWARANKLSATAGELRRLYGTLGSMYSYIAKHTPDARVYVTGYPDIIEVNGACDAVTGSLLDYSERIFLHKSLEYLNLVVRSAAQHAGITYLDIEHSLDGKKLCSRPVSTAMNGLQLGDDIAPISSLPALKLISAGTFHPTPIGHVLIADSILAGHPGLRQDISCARYPVACTGSSTTIDPPAYWGVQTAISGPLTHATDFAYAVNENSRIENLAVLAGTFEPGSTIEIKIQSQPTSLGTFIADGNGGLAASVSIPAYIEAGFHTLHLEGVNREGNMIDMYQFVTVGEAQKVATAKVVLSGGAEEALGTTKNIGVDYSAPIIGIVQPESKLLPGNPLVSEKQFTMKSSVKPDGIRGRVVGTAAVLGARTRSSNKLTNIGALAAVATNPVVVTERQHGQEDTKTNKSLLPTVAVVGMLVMMAICAVFLLTRWVKHRS